MAPATGSFNDSSITTTQSRDAPAQLPNSARKQNGLCLMTTVSLVQWKLGCRTPNIRPTDAESKTYRTTSKTERNASSGPATKTASTQISQNSAGGSVSNR